MSFPGGGGTASSALAFLTGGQELTPVMFLLVCPLLFLAGFVDSIAGGGGLISLPAYLAAGLPPHMAVATNKLSSTCGTALTTIRFIRKRLVNLKVALPSVITGIAGSYLGAKISLLIPAFILRRILFAVLPAAAFFVLNRKLFKDRGEGRAEPDARTIVTAMASAFVIGIYDGIYGPGTGTFLIIAFTVFAKLSVTSANAQAKVINLTTNITSLAIFLLHGQVIILLGLAAAACNMAGNYAGSGMVMDKGAKIVRPVIIFVLALLLLRLAAGE